MKDGATEALKFEVKEALKESRVKVGKKIEESEEKK